MARVRKGGITKAALRASLRLMGKIRKYVKSGKYKGRYHRSRKGAFALLPGAGSF